jgi:D-amino-acid dehydrogenase
MGAASHVVVVGAGVMGLCSAYYLRQRGVDVTVVEMGDVGNGSSRENAGYVSPSHFVPLAAPGVFQQGLKWMLDPRSPLYIKPRLERDFLLWTRHFARACDADVVRRAAPVLRDLLLESQRLYERMFAEDVGDCGYVKHGITMLYRTDRGRAKVEHEAEMSARVGIEARLVDRDGLVAMDPGMYFEAAGGIHYPGDAHLVPSRLVQSLTAAVERAGARIERGAALERWRWDGARVSGIETSRGVVDGNEFVLASGAWSPALVRDLGVRMLLQAGKGYSITFAAPEVTPRLPYICLESRVAVTPLPGALRFAGTMEIAGLSTTVNRTRVEAILDAVPRYFRNLGRPDAARGEVWGGMRPVTPDGLPYVGRFAAVPNLIAATGHAMVGISLGAVTGKLVSEIVCGESSGRDLALLSPDRFAGRAVPH